jgi:hypothetical protein
MSGVLCEQNSKRLCLPWEEVTVYSIIIEEIL